MCIWLDVATFFFWFTCQCPVLNTARAFKVAFAPAVSDGDGASRDEPFLFHCSQSAGDVAPVAFVPLSKPGLPATPSITKTRLVMRLACLWQVWQAITKKKTWGDEEAEKKNAELFSHRQPVEKSSATQSNAKWLWCLPRGPILIPSYTFNFVGWWWIMNLLSFENSCYIKVSKAPNIYHVHEVQFSLRILILWLGSQWSHRFAQIERRRVTLWSSSEFWGGKLDEQEDEAAINWTDVV